MARALIVGCGCRGRVLGERLLAAGWQVRGSSRDPEATRAIAAAGIDAVVADPAVVGTVYDQLDGVAVVYWLLASAAGPAEEVAPLHGARLERLLEKLVDTPVRGFVYESEGSVAAAVRERGRRLVDGAAKRWRIPAVVVAADPGDAEGWAGEMEAAAGRLTGTAA
jgi:nucleoside-diphosphate-sugar epimerase